MSEATLRWQAQRIEELEAEVALLRAERRVAGDEMVRLALWRRFRFSPTECRIAEALWDKRDSFANFDFLQTRAAFGSQGGRDDTDKALNVYICRLRKIIGHDAIETLSRRGYALTERGRAVLSSAFPKQGRAA